MRPKIGFRKGLSLSTVLQSSRKILIHVLNVSTDTWSVYQSIPTWLQNQNPLMASVHSEGEAWRWIHDFFKYFYHIPCKHIMNINYPNYYENKTRFKMSWKHNMTIFQGSCLDQSRNIAARTPDPVQETWRRNRGCTRPRKCSLGWSPHDFHGFSHGFSQPTWFLPCFSQWFLMVFTIKKKVSSTRCSHDPILWPHWPARADPSPPTFEVPS